MDPVIDLVAVAYNAPAETEAFLNSVANLVDVPFTLTVIDNDSPDPQVLSLLHKMQSKINVTNPWARNVRIIANRTNDGYSRACNFGATLGTAPLLGLLNCDVQFTLGSAKRLIEAFAREDYRDVGVLGPLTYSEFGLVTHGGILKDQDGRDKHRGWMAPIEHPEVASVLSGEMDVPTVSGATYFIRRDTWNDLTNCELYKKAAPDAQGAFLPTPHFYEETFCSYHARAHGWRVRYQGDIRMIHSWHRSSTPGSIDLGPAETLFREACAIHDIPLTF